MDISEATFKEIVRESTLAGRKQLRIIVPMMLALATGGGAGLVYTQGKIEDSIDSRSAWTQSVDKKVLVIEQHDRELIAQSERIEAIAILLVQQGRHFENMVRSVAPRGSRLPDRPAALDAIEAQILRREGR